MDLKAMNPYILRNTQKLYWDAGVPRVCKRIHGNTFPFSFKYMLLVKGDLV